MNRKELQSLRVIFALTYFCLVMVETAAAQVERKPFYVISDLHFNIGQPGNGPWNPLEDFRFPRAFRGFLRKIATDHSGGIDLVIAGDFLELWQSPTLPCGKIRDSECGCTIEEMKQLVRAVIDGHQAEFAALGDFLKRESNQVFVTPGNHDSALMEDEVWDLVLQAIPQGRERFIRVRSGTWFSQDNLIAVEHGHQQTFEANSFPDWPDRVTKDCDGERRLFRPWGENFVQSLYNDVEAEFPLIDNLIPESAGVAIYSQYSEIRGRKSEEVARFLIFNLLETSFYQKLQVLELNKETGSLTDADVKRCRHCLQEDLVLMSIPDAEAYLRKQDALGAAPETGAVKPLRQALREQVTSLDDNSARALCERAVLLNKGRLPLAGPGAGDRLCERPLATAVNKIFDPEGTHVLKDRVNKLYDQNPKLAIYIFGHTHEAKNFMRVQMIDKTNISAYNTGAFQRQINEEVYFQKKQENENEVDLLRRLTHDDLAPCYTVVRVAYAGKVPKAEVMQWFMSEEEQGQGQFLNACDTRCTAPPGNCRRSN